MKRWLCLLLLGCGEPATLDAGVDAAPEPVDAFVAPLDAPRGLGLRVITFNTGTTPGLDHDSPPDDG